MVWLIIAASAALIACLLLVLKIAAMRKSVDEILSCLELSRSSDTNSVIGISSSDKKLRALTDLLNSRLEELRREQLRYQNGDRELKDAITNISHDIRTPLTAIIGYLDIMERMPRSGEDTRCLAVIRERAEAMKELTEELFSYSVILSEKTRSEPSDTDIGRALEDSIMAHYAVFTERGIVPEVSLPEEKIIRKVDQKALSRVLANLLSNAAKYSEGDLSVALKAPCVMTFSNLAPSLSQTQVERLFDRFYTVKTARGSTGLGLSIARTLTADMGGSLTASLNNSRLTITLSLPE